MSSPFKTLLFLFLASSTFTMRIDCNSQPLELIIHTETEYTIPSNTCQFTSTADPDNLILVNNNESQLPLIGGTCDFRQKLTEHEGKLFSYSSNGNHPSKSTYTFLSKDLYQASTTICTKYSCVIFPGEIHKLYLFPPSLSSPCPPHHILYFLHSEISLETGFTPLCVVSTLLSPETDSKNPHQKVFPLPPNTVLERIQVLTISPSPMPRRLLYLTSTQSLNIKFSSKVKNFPEADIDISHRTYALPSLNISFPSLHRIYPHDLSSLINGISVRKIRLSTAIFEVFGDTPAFGIRLPDVLGFIYLDRIAYHYYYYSGRHQIVPKVKKEGEYEDMRVELEFDHYQGLYVHEKEFDLRGYKGDEVEKKMTEMGVKIVSVESLYGRVEWKMAVSKLRLEIEWKDKSGMTRAVMKARKGEEFFDGMLREMERGEREGRRTALERDLLEKKVERVRGEYRREVTKVLEMKKDGAMIGVEECYRKMVAEWGVERDEGEKGESMEEEEKKKNAEKPWKGRVAVVAGVLAILVLLLCRRRKKVSRFERGVLYVDQWPSEMKKNGDEVEMTKVQGEEKGEEKTEE